MSYEFMIHDLHFKVRWWRIVIGSEHGGKKKHCLSKAKCLRQVTQKQYILTAEKKNKNENKTTSYKMGQQDAKMDKVHRN